MIKHLICFLSLQYIWIDFDVKVLCNSENSQSGVDRSENHQNGTSINDKLINNPFECTTIRVHEPGLLPCNLSLSLRCDI